MKLSQMVSVKIKSNKKYQKKDYCEYLTTKPYANQFSYLLESDFVRGKEEKRVLQG